MSPPLLEIRSLRVGLEARFGNVPLVDGVDLELFPGRTLGLVGESGSGKTLTALATMGLLPEGVRQQGGEVRFDGGGPGSGQSARGDQITMVFQEPMTALNPVLKVGEQVAEGLRLHRRLDHATAWQRGVQALREVGVGDPERRADSYPHELSGGLRQRVLMAMALVVEPRLLIADEPTTAVDATVQAQMLALLRQRQRERGLAVWLITHDLGVVARACDDVAVMYAGRVVERAPAAAFLAGPRHPYSLALLRALPDGSRRRLEAIPGSVPAPTARPAGCSFRGRCPRETAACAAAEPPLVELSPGHGVACFCPEGPDEVRV